MTATRTVGVGVFVIRDGRILLGKRGPACKRGAGCWALPGGMLKEGESVVECVARELREETGLEWQSRLESDGDIPLLGLTDHFRDKVEPEPHLSAWVVAPGAAGEPRVTEPDKCLEWRWMDGADIVLLEGATKPEHNQYYWTPVRLWQHWLSGRVLGWGTDIHIRRR